MSLERLKGYSEKFAKLSLVLIAAIVTIIVCETICFMWQALMPGKLHSFFSTVKLYLPFITDIDNNALCLYELGISIFKNLFAFVILTVARRMFLKFSKTISLGSVTSEIKTLALILIADAVALPVMKLVSYNIFTKEVIHSGIFDVSPIILGALLYYIALVIQSKSVFKEETEE